jgi:hypothetical protein
LHKDMQDDAEAPKRGVLTKELLRDRALASEPLRVEDLAEEFGVSHSRVRQVVAEARATWGDVPIVFVREGALADRIAKLLEWAEARDEPFTITEAGAVIGRGTEATSRLLHRLADGPEARVVRLGPMDGWLAKTRFDAQSPATSDRLRIDALARVAAEALDPQLATVQHGPRTADQWREVTRLTPAQFKDVNTALGHLRRFSKSEFVPAAVMAWDEQAQDFAGVQLVAAHVTGSPATVAKVRVGLRLVLHLATNRGLIFRSERPNLGKWGIAPHFLPLVDVWEREVCQAEGKRGGQEAFRRQVRQGVRQLMRVATELGSAGPADTDWKAVREDIVRRCEKGGGSISAAKLVYSHLPQLYEIGGRWPHRAEGRGARGCSAVSRQALESIVTQVEEETGGGSLGGRWLDWTGWEAYDAVIDGPYGLDAYVTWVSAPDSVIRARGLPNRHEVGSRRQRRGDGKFSPSTIRNRLRKLNMLLGWAARERPAAVEPGKGLANLAALDVLEAFESWYRKRGKFSRSTMQTTAIALMMVGRPFLVAVARSRGDDVLVKRIESDANGFERIITRYEATIDEQRAKNKRIAAVWGRGAPGIIKLRRLRDEQERVIEALGEAPVAEQLARLRAGDTTWTTVAWAKQVRNTAMLALLRKIPFRAHTVARLGIARSPDEAAKPRWSWIENVRGDSDTGRGALGPWEGGIRFHCPPSIMKGKRTFAPWLLQADLVGDAEWEADIGRSLLELYLRPGGARDVLCREGGYPDSPWLFVTGSEPSEYTSSGQLPEGALSEIFRDEVTTHAEAIGLDVDAAAKVHGALGAHAIRVLFATHFVKINPKWTQLLLHHRDLKLTVDLYDGSTEDDVRLLARDEGPSVVRHLTCQLEEAQARNRELERKLDELLARLPAGRAPTSAVA